MFSGECSVCGSGLRDRDAKCRLCGAANPRSGSPAGARIAASSPFGESSPADVESSPRPTSFAAAALAPPTFTEQRKAAQRTRPRKTG
jgi:hypothetical protein